jgi:hypothetical protein
MDRAKATSMLVIAGTIGSLVAPPHFKHEGEVVVMARPTQHGLHVDQHEPERPLVAPVVAAVTTGTIISPGTGRMTMTGHAAAALTTGSAV